MTSKGIPQRSTLMLSSVPARLEPFPEIKSIMTRRKSMKLEKAFPTSSETLRPGQKKVGLLEALALLVMLTSIFDEY